MIHYLLPAAFWEPRWIMAVSALVTALGGAIGAVIGSRHSKKAIGDIKRQVQNDHGTNLRDDMDRIGDAVDKALNEFDRIAKAVDTVGADIGGLRSELRQARKDDAQLRESLEHVRSEAAREHEKIRAEIREKTEYQ